MSERPFAELIDKTLTAVQFVVKAGGTNEVVFVTFTGDKYCMFHDQDCCESVYLEDVNGDWQDVIGAPILLAEESSNRNDPPKADDDDSYTWTFYRLGTVKGTVVIRWYGSSNGYYSEAVDFVKVQ